MGAMIASATSIPNTWNGNRPSEQRPVVIIMNVRDVIHRLRIRANNAQNAGDYALAADLRLAIATLEQLEKERMFRPVPAK